MAIAADQPQIEDAARELRDFGTTIEAVECDLATLEGIDRLYSALGGRPVDVSIANARRGLGKAFLDRDFADIRRVMDTNITGALTSFTKSRATRAGGGRGRILITGSNRFRAGAFSAVDNASKAFIDSFSFALRDELKDIGTTVTRVMLGATCNATLRARRYDGHPIIARSPKDDPIDVAQIGFEAMMHGDGDIVSGKNNCSRRSPRCNVARRSRAPVTNSRGAFQ